MLHGVVRFTADLDLIFELSENNLKRFVKFMGELGYGPKQLSLPLIFADLNYALNRRMQSMVAFSFYHTEKPVNLEDVFIAEPLPFSSIEKELVWFEAGNVKISVVSKAHLKQLKQIAGLPQDIVDIEILDEFDEEEGKP